MRLLLILFLLVATGSQAQIATVTTAGIGDIKIGMSKAELEKITGNPVKLVRLLKSTDWERDTLHFTHKNIAYTVILDKDYINEKSSGYIIYEIRSADRNLKTRSGIGIGDDKLKIVSMYNDYMIQIMPAYEDDFKTKSKTRSTVWLHGEDGKLIVFYLTNNKVTEFSVMYDEGC